MWNSIEKNILGLPVPINLRLFWNFGSLLGLRLIIQIISGLFLAFHFKNDVQCAFLSVDEIYRNVKLGWLIRVCHSNGARIFFFCIYLHIGRRIYYDYFQTQKKTWISGCLILLILMATAFLGYVLPWGQISLWGATVITNLFSAIPFIGREIVFWLWGGFSVDSPTLRRFFTLHFVLPFVILGITIIHLLFLHENGSRNPAGFNSNIFKIKFYPYFLIKDLIGFFIYFFIYFFIVFFYPWLFADPENFILANSIVTPVHIQPEWYYLFAYTILRAIPRKLGGVLALFASVLIFMIIPFLIRKRAINGRIFNPVKKLHFWIFVNVFFILTWLGAKPARGCFIVYGQYLTISYFQLLLSLDGYEILWWSLLEFIKSYFSALLLIKRIFF